MKNRAMNFEEEPDDLNHCDDFEAIEEDQPVDDVISFMKERGHEFSPYTVDWARETVLFVRTQEGVDLKEHFYLQLAQRTYVRGLLSIPFSHLPAVAAAVAERIADVRNIFVYITARCGSTLVVKATNALPSAMAIHAPDVYSIIAMAYGKVQNGETPGDTGKIPDVLRDD
ncbi:Hypp1401 [Branchiostoma lanceolatum]|uniref:Hypp1401 protein n=1 Tax=Branchiostoma lanceolatum TaxID=7740 RepID=A0A8J9ZHP5_BRALA|nr:Hypp1401 [Branchiostoma lanceolatum]